MVTQWWCTFVSMPMTYIVPEKVYYIHIPKTGGTTEKYKLKEMYGNDLIQVPTGKHSPYDERYAHYDCIYTHVRNPHTRMLSMYLFHNELDHMPEKHIDKERWNFLDTEFRWYISRLLGAHWEDISDFDKLIMQKMKPLHSNISPDNYVKWLDLVGKANDKFAPPIIERQTSSFGQNTMVRPFVQQYKWITWHKGEQHNWISDKVHVKRIEDEEGDLKLNQTTRMPGHNDDEYIEAGRSLIQQYYSEDLRRFGYE